MSTQTSIPILDDKISEDTEALFCQILRSHRQNRIVDQDPSVVYFEILDDECMSMHSLTCTAYIHVLLYYNVYAWIQPHRHAHACIYTFMHNLTPMSCICIRTTALHRLEPYCIDTEPNTNAQTNDLRSLIYGNFLQNISGLGF